MKRIDNWYHKDGNWTEIDAETWDEASRLMMAGYSVKIPDGYKPSGKPIFKPRKKIITRANF